jgi:hypothetical protein
MIAPQVAWSAKNCEAVLNIGLFFDGTNNNMDRDFPRLADSNIARLYNSYRKDLRGGYYRVYVPGVGTRFPEIGEDGESNLGKGCAFGCEERVIFALLSVFNAFHHRGLGSDMFDDDAVLALCRNGFRVSDPKDRESLAKLNMEVGLLSGKADGISVRKFFFERQDDGLKLKLKNCKPRIVECFLDVFGFSRGAAEARVFCNWLNELLVNGRLAGVPLQFRFIGIIDTVASAGFWSGTTALAMNSTGGHGAWASASSLQIPASVRNCVHMLAMHELRRNFPLDAIDISKTRPGCIQQAYPGSHSDVGGGYRPGELGLATGDDSQKLSQIPLNHMLDFAVAAGAPLSRPEVVSGGYNPFAIHPDLVKAYDAFISHATSAPRPMYEFLQPYLNWRWQMRDRFHMTNQVKRADPTDRETLLTFNRSLVSDAAAMTRSAGMTISKRTLAVLRDILSTGARKDLVTTSFLEPEARSVLALAQKSAQTPPAYTALFDGYVHDPLAGFNAPSLEMPGYWRYRRVFLGTDDHIIAANHNADAARSAA